MYKSHTNINSGQLLLVQAAHSEHGLMSGSKKTYLKTRNQSQRLNTCTVLIQILIQKIEKKTCEGAMRRATHRRLKHRHGDSKENVGKWCIADQ